MKQMVYMLSLLVVLSGCAHADQKIVVGSITLKILDDETNEPVSGVAVYSECKTARPRFFLGMPLLDNGVFSTCFEQKYVSGSDGLVIIPERMKTGQKRERLYAETYWINIEKNADANTAKRIIDTKYGGIYLSQSYGGGKTIVEPWRVSNNIWMQNYYLGSDELSNPNRVVTLRLRRATEQSE